MSMCTVVKVGGSLCADPVRLGALLASLAEGAFGSCLVVPGGGAHADAVRAAQLREGFDDAEAHRRALDAMSRMAADFHAIEPRLPLSVLPWRGLRIHTPSLAFNGSRAAPLGPLSHGVKAGVRAGVKGVTSPGSSRPSPCPSPARERGPASQFEGAADDVTMMARRRARESGGSPLKSEIWDVVALRSGHPDIPETWDVTSDSLALWAATQIRAARCLLVKSVDAPAGADARDLAFLGLVDAAFPSFAARYGGHVAILGPGGETPIHARDAA